MANVVKPLYGNLVANAKTRIETKAKFDALTSERFIINAYDGKGGIFKKMSDDPWQGVMGAAQPGRAPYVAGYYGSLEGQTGDIVEFRNVPGLVEIGAGNFAFGAKVYAIVAADLTVTITDVPAVGRYYIGTVEIPLVADGDNKFVWVCLYKDGQGFYLIDKVAAVALSGTITAATETDIVNGAKTIILTIKGDTFKAYDGVTTYLAATANKIIDGISHVAGTNDLAKVITALKAAVADGENTAVVRTSATVLTITLPAVAGYNIAVAEEIAVMVDPIVLESSSHGLWASPSATIATV